MINDQPYTEELAKQRAKEIENRSFEERRRENRHFKEFSKSSDIVTILFEGTDNEQDFVSLDFQTNATDVNNETNYYKRPQLSLIKRIKEGLHVVEFKAYKFSNFLDDLKELTNVKSDKYIRDIIAKEHSVGYTGPNWNNPLDKQNHYFHDETNHFKSLGNLDLDLNKGLKEWFESHPRFRIDPDSDIKLTILRNRAGDEIYSGGLALRVYTGISDAPGQNFETVKKIDAIIKYKK